MKGFKLLSALAALALAAGSLGAAEKAGQPERSCATRFVSQKPASTRRKSPTSIRAPSRSMSSRPLYTYDYLARPVKVVPLLADGMPEVSSDFKTYTVKLKRGVVFADDPAFCDADGKNCKKREVTAQDVVYTIKRIYDPKNKSGMFNDFEEAKLAGMNELRAASEKPGARFDYDSEVEGLRALDRYTVQFKLGITRPRFLYNLADSSVVGVVAREVVEKYGDHIMEHPVGTGPFMLEKWQRSAHMSFVRNPNFREMHYIAEPAPDDAQAQALYKQFKGRRLPMLDRVEVSIIEEEQAALAGLPGT